MTTLENARGRWRHILTAFDIPVPKRHGSCPDCGGKDRFRLTEKEFVLCNQCMPQGIPAYKYLRDSKGWTDKIAMAKVDEVLKVDPSPRQALQQSKKDPRPLLREIWHKSRPWHEVTEVRHHIMELDLDPEDDRVLRGVESLSHYNVQGKRTEWPAMVAMIQAPDGTPISWHRTWLDKNGQKADVDTPRKMCPPIKHLAGSSIRLCNADKTMGIAEGIETALAAMAFFGKPTWAVGSASLMESWEPPEGVENIYIFGDNDESYTGQKAAYSLANRLIRHYNVRVEIPDFRGQDWLDVWMEDRRAKDRFQ